MVVIWPNKKIDAEWRINDTADSEEGNEDGLFLYKCNFIVYTTDQYKNIDHVDFVGCLFK